MKNANNYLEIDMRTFIKYLSVFINLFFVVLYIFALLAAVVPSNKFVWFSYFGLAFPLLVLINIGYVVFWIINKKWWFLISFTLLVATYRPLNRTFSIHPENQKEIIENSEIKLLSYNISMFTNKKKYDEIMKFIAEADADIVCLQEFGFYNSNTTLSQDEIVREFEKKYPYHHLWYKNQRNKFWWGVATFSKYPISNKQKVDYQSAYNVSIYSDINVKGETVRVFNNHLESNKFTRNNLKEYQELADNPTNNQLKKVTQIFTTKLGSAYRARAKQAQAVAKEIAQSPYSVVVCGDFNDVPQSYAYHKIAHGMCDALTTKMGYNYTFYGSGLLVHIDQILASKKHFSPISSEICHIKYSDHYPVIATLGVIK